MSREIRSPQEVAIPVMPSQNAFKDRLVKLIPSEIVTAYITLYGLITSNGGENQRLFLIIAFVSLLILTPLYLIKVSEVRKIGQITFTTIAFIIWVMATGGFNILFPGTTIFENNFLGSMLLIIYTLVIPFVYKG